MKCVLCSQKGLERKSPNASQVVTEGEKKVSSFPSLCITQDPFVAFESLEILESKNSTP